MEKQLEYAEYIEKLSAQLLAWDIQIERFKDKAENAPIGTASDYSEVIAALQIKRDEAAEKLQGISTASDHEWEELKEGTEQVWGEVRKMLFDAVIKIK